VNALYGAVYGPFDYGGLQEVADYLGVTKQVITNWRKRPYKMFPQPVADLNMGPVWRLCDIRDWQRNFYDG